MVNQSDVVVFMKGVPSAPRCGFSNAVCQIMRMHDVPFESHDVLSDEEVRQGKCLIQSNLAIRNFLVALKLFHNAKSSLSL